MTRAVLAAVLFAIGLLILLFVSLNQAQFRKEGSVRLRPDLWDWVNRRAEETNETPQRITERSIAAYRDHLDEGVRSA
jgi:hypothetical protein